VAEGLAKAHGAGIVVFGDGCDSAVAHTQHERIAAVIILAVDQGSARLHFGRDSICLRG
jgi:hypothetical protein